MGRMTLQHDWAFPDADTFMRNEIRADGSYQRDHLEAALQYVTDFSVAIDGGAHVGTWSRLLSQAFQQVIAVEPAPDTFTSLSVNMTAFGCTNVVCRQVALGDSPGLCSLGLDAKEAARQNTGARHITAGQDIEIVGIDDWNLPNVGFLKLDIEGSEPAALRGARQTLERCRPIVLFEDKSLWKRYGEAMNAPVQILQRAWYRKLQSIGCDQIWGPR
jgi:FkbM family methyltransferase